MNAYFTLLVKSIDDRWQSRWLIEFGSHDLQDVLNERQYYMECYNRSQKDTKILRTANHDYSLINAAVAKLNS